MSNAFVVTTGYGFVFFVFVVTAFSYRNILVGVRSQLESDHDNKHTHPIGDNARLALHQRPEARKKRPPESTIGGVGIGGDKPSQPQRRQPQRRQPQRRKPQRRQPPVPSGGCAILLFGLPRAFREFVLPSLEANVIRPNARHGCDYFVHYYEQASEASGRSGRGGTIRAGDVGLLEDSVRRIHAAGGAAGHAPRVSLVSDTNETFWGARGAVIETYRTARNADGNYTYYPYGERTYEYPGTLDNIVKQWHSVNAVWESMEEASGKNNNNDDDETTTSHGQYRRVAMMRNDVVYLTPIDIYGVSQAATEWNAEGENDKANTEDNNNNNNNNNTTGPAKIDDYDTNSFSVIPGFAKYPVNDRMIYGPHDAVETWASKRFDLIEDYARDPSAKPGMVMHSETFLNASVLETIRREQQPSSGVLVEDRTICFLRVRADGAIWIEDCDATKSGFGGGYPGGMAAYTKLLREFLPDHGKGCGKRLVRDKVRKIVELFCPGGGNSTGTGTGGTGGGTGGLTKSARLQNSAKNKNRSKPKTNAAAAATK